MLKIVGLDGAAGRRVKGYSLGMRQRLGLASALLGEPELLMLDEPANGLDPEGVRWLRDFLRAFAKGGRTVLVSSHVLAEVAQTVDRVLIINRGRLVIEAPLDELTARLGGAVRVRSPQATTLQEALGREGIGGARRRRRAERERHHDRAGRRDRGGVGRRAARARRRRASSLEQIFLELTSEPADRDRADPRRVAEDPLDPHDDRARSAAWSPSSS